jgi:hypothetical protein
MEIRKLEAIGNYDDLEFPEELMESARCKNPDEDASITLTDIYQFLLFEGDIARMDPQMKKVKTNFKGIKDKLHEQMTTVQKNTAEKVVRRIYRKIVPCDVHTQTPEDPLIEE